MVIQGMRTTCRSRGLGLGLVLVASVVACQGRREDAPAAQGSATEEGSASEGSAETPIAEAPAAPEDAGPRPEEPETPDPGKVISELDAVPAWKAVIDRWQYLARRNQRGVVYGRLGPPVAPAKGTDADDDAGVPASPYTWLVDDTEGHGSLGIRVRLDRFASQVSPGDRVALGGAWKLDEERRWYWDVDSVTQVPISLPTELPEPPSPVPTHVIATGPAPADAVPISAARDNAVVTFQLVGSAPRAEGDGWPIGDGPGKPVVAILRLPGEWSTYGGQDMRTPDERWRLEPKRTYWVRIGKIRRRGANEPFTINARTAPVRVP